MCTQYNRITYMQTTLFSAGRGIAFNESNSSQAEK